MHRLSSIMVGTDFSRCSAVAVEQALRMAAWNRATVHVAHILDTLVVADLQERVPAFQTEVRENLVRGAREAWASFAAGIGGAGGAGGAATLELDVQINHRVAGLIQHAAGVKADLMVLGAHGDSAPNVGAGTVATGCVRKAPCDVLLVRDTQRGLFKSILACVDFSDTSRRALERAARIAVEDGAALHVLHVHHPVTNLVPFSVTFDRAFADAQMRTEAELKGALEVFCKELGAPAVYLKPRPQIIACSSPGWGIVEAATRVGADLVVLGTRGRTNLRDILLGSTAERVLRDSRCSILAVKPAPPPGVNHPLVSDDTPVPLAPKCPPLPPGPAL